MSRHEFGDTCFAFAFVVASAVFCGEHHEVSNLVDVLWRSVFVGVVCLTNLSSREVVLGLLNVECNTRDNVVGIGVLDGWWLKNKS
jgi:hypothetical protein